jgi:hypothetical protein
MPLDEATLKLTSTLERDLQRLVERQRARGSRGEEVRYDSVSRMATWETRRGDVIGRWYGEIVASYVITDRILRWAWAGRTSLATPSHAEVISQEGNSRGVAQLSMSVVGDLDEEEAATLARLGVLVSRGEGLEVRRTETDIHFIGLFDSSRPRETEVSPSRYSVPPPPVRPVARAGSTPAPVAYRSIPPVQEVYEPRSTPRSTPSSPPQHPPASSPSVEKKIREPARGLLVPVASSAMHVLQTTVPGFQQGLFVLDVHTEALTDLQSLATGAHKRRLLVTLVALDAAGMLRALEPSHELVDAAARMVEADRLDGNGPWRKLTARVAPKADGGATLHVDVI